MRDHGDDQDDRAVVVAGLGQRGAHLVGGGGAEGTSPEALRGLDEVDQLPLPLELREDEALLQALVVVLDELPHQRRGLVEDVWRDVLLRPQPPEPLLVD